MENNLLELINYNMVGYVIINSLGGASYFVTFICDAYKKVWAYPLKNRGEMFELFYKFHVLLKERLTKCLSV